MGFKSTDSLKSYRGFGGRTFSSGKGGDSGFPETKRPPVISSVGLTTTAGPNRFTSQDFTVTTTMLNDGPPISQKGVKATVTASLQNYPSTDTVTNVTEDFTNTSFGSLADPSGFTNSATGGIVYITSNGVGKWIFVMAYGSGGNHRVCQSTDGTTWSQINSDWNGTPVAPYGIHNVYVAGDYIFAHDNNSSGWGYGLISSPSAFEKGPDDGRKGFSYDGTYYYCGNTSGINRGTSPSSMSNVYSISSMNYMQTAVSDSGVILAAGRYVGGSPYPTRTYRSTNQGSTWTRVGDIEASANRDLERIYYYNNAFYAILDNLELYKSTDNGDSWSVVTPTGYSGVRAIESDGRYLYIIASISTTRHVLRTANNGGSWTSIGSVTPGGAAWDMSFGGGRIGLAVQNSSNHVKVTTGVYGTQTLTLSSNTNLGGLGNINVNDVVRKSGTSEYAKVTAINTNTPSITISAPPTINNGDTLTSVLPSGSAQETTKYLSINSSGDVSDLLSTDPGFVDYGPGTEVTLSFPATFPTGNAPDVELPAGASIRAEIRAVNDAATDTELSNIVTPT